jgi:hypothetical protein
LELGTSDPASWTWYFLRKENEGQRRMIAA